MKSIFEIYLGLKMPVSVNYYSRVRERSIIYGAQNYIGHSTIRTHGKVVSWKGLLEESYVKSESVEGKIKATTFQFTDQVAQVFTIHKLFLLSQAKPYQYDQ